MMSAKEFEVYARKAMDAALAKGWNIRDQITLEENGSCCCVLGACAVAWPNDFLRYDPEMDQEETFEEIADVDIIGTRAGLNDLQIEGLVSGFDNSNSHEVTPYDPEFLDLGHRLRKDYVL